MYRSELAFSAVLGEVKYKISVFGAKAKMKPAKPASLLAGNAMALPIGWSVS